MNEMPREATLAELRKILGDAFGPENVRVARGHAGAVFLRALADDFEDDEDPEVVVSEILAKHGLRLPEHTLATLRAPRELDASERARFFPPLPHFRGTPSFADALLAEPEKDPDDDRHFRCRVVAFWGIKGGVGRTTALAHVASILGRGRKVLALDLDLDSPGLVATLARDTNGDRPRFETLVRLAGDSNVSHAELVKQIEKALRPAKQAPRAKVLGPAKADTEFVKDLLGPLAPSSMYRGDRQALRKLVRAAILAADAEIALVDARSGYCDESAMAVLDLADEVVVFVSPAPSTFGSLGPAIEALERNRRALGRPKLVHVVAGMLPAGEETRTRVMEQLQGAIDDERRRVAEILDTPTEELPPDIFVMPVMYSGRVVENEGRVLEDTESIYSDLAHRIAPPEASTTSMNMPYPLNVEQALRDSAVFFGTLSAQKSPPELVAVPIDTLLHLIASFVNPPVTLGAIFGLESLQAGPPRRDIVSYAIFGERLDEIEGRAPATPWLRARLQDGKGELPPHVLWAFLARAFSIRTQSASPHGVPLLDPESMRAALPQVASQCLQEALAAADPETKRAIEALKGQDADQPREKLAAHLKKATGDDRAEARLKDLGFLRVTRRHDGTEMVRIVDLYALAPELGVRRVGRR